MTNAAHNIYEKHGILSVCTPVGRKAFGLRVIPNEDSKHVSPKQIIELQDNERMLFVLKEQYPNPFVGDEIEVDGAKVEVEVTKDES